MKGSVIAVLQTMGGLKIGVIYDGRNLSYQQLPPGNEPVYAYECWGNKLKKVDKAVIQDAVLGGLPIEQIIPKLYDKDLKVLLDGEEINLGDFLNNVVYEYQKRASKGEFPYTIDKIAKDEESGYDYYILNGAARYYQDISEYDTLTYEAKLWLDSLEKMKDAKEWVSLNRSVIEKIAKAYDEVIRSLCEQEFNKKLLWEPYLKKDDVIDKVRKTLENPEYDAASRLWNEMVKLCEKYDKKYKEIEGDINKEVEELLTCKELTSGFFSQCIEKLKNKHELVQSYFNAYEDDLKITESQVNNNENEERSVIISGKERKVYITQEIGVYKVETVLNDKMDVIRRKISVTKNGRTNIFDLGSVPKEVEIQLGTCGHHAVVLDFYNSKCGEFFTFGDNKETSFETINDENFKAFLMDNVVTKEEEVKIDEKDDKTGEYKKRKVVMTDIDETLEKLAKRDIKNNVKNDLNDVNLKGNENSNTP